MLPLPRCARHKEAAELPALCHTCQRINVEQQIVVKCVDALLAAGFALNTSERPAVATKDRAIILAELMEADDEYLSVHSDDGNNGGWVRFVYGNDGFDVISDYTVGLDRVLQPVNDFASAFATGK